MIYVENLMEALRGLSDADHQRRTWLASGGPEISSFSEMVSQAFDDTGLANYIDTNRCPHELDHHPSRR